MGKRISQKPYSPAYILLIILTLFLVYLILIYPTERARILQPNKTASTNLISIEDKSFVPAEMKINQGENVVWENNDKVKHRIKGLNFQSSVLYPGETYRHAFQKTGTYEYTSDLHPEATGKIIVE